MSPTMHNSANFLPGLLDRKDAVSRCYLERLRGSKLVFTNGVFDILHRGHVEYLYEARSLGDLLLVGLNSDSSASRLKGSGRPLNNEFDRASVLLALRCVDLVVLFEEDTPEDLIKALEPSILVKGGDYEISQIAGADFVKSRGGEVLTIPFRSGYSTTSLISRIAKSDK